MDGELMSRFGNLQAAFRPRRTEVEHLFNSAYDGFINASRMSANARLSKVFEIEKSKALLDPRLHLFSRLISATGNTVSQRDTMSLQIESLRLLLAIESHLASEGRPPVSLSELVPDYIDSIPLDPLNGLEFGYRTGEHEVARHGYVLYSFGRDGLDDSGYFNPNDPGLGYRFGAGDGVDILINAVSKNLVSTIQN